MKRNKTERYDGPLSLFCRHDMYPTAKKITRFYFSTGM